MMKNTQSNFSRRRFIGSTGAAALSLSVAGRSSVLGANNTVRVALLGAGGRAASLAAQFSAAKDCAITVLCDPDTAQMEALTSKMAKKDVDLSQAAHEQDYRKVLERDDVDAVVICSPNYWHALQSIQAMEAGKDVYVEKPVSHSLWEGKQLVAAEQKYGRIIAGGFQNRSDPGPQAGIQYVQEGNLGKILSVHAVCMRNRTTIGKQESALQPPETLDYNLWLGPCQDEVMHRPRFHYDWHWVWNTGNGDVGNQAPHEIDMACWVLGDPVLPESVHCFGQRFGWNDAGETPNMLSTWYEQAGVPCLIEVNDMWLAPERNTSPVRSGIRVGIVVKCEGGELRGGRGGMYSVADDGKTKLEKFPGDGGKNHQENFLEAVRSRSSGGLRSKLAEAERSSAVAHLANISYLSGATASSEAVDEAIGNHEMLRTISEEQSRQLTAWGIEDPDYILGKKIAVDPSSAEVTTEGADPRLIKKDYRDPFIVPELA
ncbi:MAG: Gfo/Idh/MocA family oxidoreductase [Verrucomicrobiota bacterium]